MLTTNREKIVAKTKSVESVLGRSAVLCFSDQDLEWLTPSQTNISHTSIDQQQKIGAGKYLLGYSPDILDAIIFRALAANHQPGAGTTSVHVRPGQSQPRQFLMAQNPEALADAQGYVQITDSRPFTHVNNDPEIFPWFYEYKGSRALPVYAQEQVTAQDLARPIVKIPENIEVGELLTGVATIREMPDDNMLQVVYTNTQQATQYLPLHNINQ